MTLGLLESVTFDAQGLVVAVAQDQLTGEVRMVAYMNREALALTLSTGLAHFWSRSRRALWKKGESSGNTLSVRSVSLDCDGDAVLLRVDPAGATCHTGAPSCFFRSAHEGQWREERLLPEPEALYARANSRRESTQERSYTRSLLDAGSGRICEKILEEAAELAEAVEAQSDARVVSEASDLVYHLMVALVHRAIPWRTVLCELSRRAGTSGLDEKASRGRE